MTSRIHTPSLLFLLFLGSVAFLPRSEALEATHSEGRRVTVEQVKNAKNLITSTGEQIRIASIQAPNVEELIGRKRPGEPMGAQAMQAVRDLIEGKEVSVEVSTVEPTDRHGRTVALVKLDDGLLLQEALIHDGLAMAYPFPDSREHMRSWQEVEQEARQQRRGMWGHPYWQVADAATMSFEKPRYILVEGVVHEAKNIRGNWYVNFDQDYRKDFTGFVTKEDYQKYFDGFDLAGLSGKRVRLRGWLYERNGPAMDITLPEQIEVLE